MNRQLRTKEKIRAAAADLFIRHTVSRVTADEIASYAGMSKKTLYNHFSSKEELEREVFLHFIHDIRLQIGRLAEEDTDFLHKLQNLMRIITHVTGILSDRLIEDLQQSKRELWRMIDEERHISFVEGVTPIFRQGQQQGFIRNNIDIPFVMEMLYQNIRIISDSEFIRASSRSLAELAPLMLDIFMNGIMEKGK
ncbi:MAG TPA: helix-turn-helix domain-containing protein [Candidatus Mcinerneyibacteriales bacterium]|jgi:AcrR family transcriptional regulator|nr:helix-turn-helix domain-containing protein [Candidatus Mcinerneyibacteriales bacterium]HPE20757.1 helix-turn-helix domain-containing protein [Candidatus Mcinerneyibacteriales bacterium]HPJ69690.1 helix-turn-helix domain-containing protein [Candidatus Mcinerneyibacteriales bacterium]HPQ90158.1 helix-turn-helix domain-containing protein [Candidatus Mcinerneyibacteriales bacterium]